MYSKFLAPIALICAPLGFVLPLLIGLKGLEVWPLAIGIWLAGVFFSVAGATEGIKLSGGRLVALWVNGLLATLFGVLTFVVGGVTLH